MPKKDLTEVKENLEKTGAAVGDLFKGLFNGLIKILDVAQEMEKAGERIRSFKREFKGVSRTGKELRGEAGWRIKTGLLEGPAKKRK